MTHLIYKEGSEITERDEEELETTQQRLRAFLCHLCLLHTPCRDKKKLWGCKKKSSIVQNLNL